MPSLDEDIQRGEEAKRLLATDAHKRAVAAVHAAIVQAMVDCPLQDKQLLHELKLILKLHKDYMSALEFAIKNGQIAAHNLEIERTAAEKLKRLF